MFTSNGVMVTAQNPPKTPLHEAIEGIAPFRCNFLQGDCTVPSILKFN